MDGLSGAGIHLASAYVTVHAELAPFERGLSTAEAQTQAFARSTTAATAQATKGLNSNAKAAEAMGSRYVGVGKRMSSVGKTMTRTVTAPIVGIGVAAGVMSLKFNRAMTEISTQAGASQREVKRLSAEVLKLSSEGRYAQGPQDLASALFDIESVGYRGAKAMSTLGAASDLAAVGNADLEATTSGLVGTLKTGIKGAKDAKEAIGYLNATIGAGKLHMEELNGAIGTGFLGSAKALGISLQSSGAALAELTSQAVPANSAATRLRMAFSLLANPTEKAQKVLGSIGLGSETMARQMRGPDGLNNALETLQEHLKGLSKVEQNQLLSAAFGGAKSGGTILQLLGNLDDLDKKYHEIGEHAGDFQHKLDETNAEPAIKLDKAWSALQSDLIQIGNDVVPALTPVLLGAGKAVTELADGFESLPKPAKEVLGGVLLLTAAIGPLLRVSGFLAKGWGTLLLAADKLELALTGQAAVSASVVGANAAMGESYVALSATIREAAAAQGSFSATESGLLVPGAVGMGAGLPLKGGRFSGFLNKGMRGLLVGGGLMAAGGLASQSIGGRAGQLAGNVGTYAGIGAGIGSVVPGVGTALGAGVGAGVGAVKADIELLTGAEKKLNTVQARAIATAQGVGKAFAEQGKASRGLKAAEQSVTSAKQHQHETAKGVESAEAHLTAMRERFGPASRPAIRAEYDLAQARDKNTQAANKVDRAEQLKGLALAAYKAQTQQALGLEGKQIAILKNHRDAAAQLFRQEKDRGASQHRLAETGGQVLSLEGKLKNEERKRAATAGDAAAKVSSAWAKRMKKTNWQELLFGTLDQTLDKSMPALSKLEHMKGPPSMKAFTAGLKESAQTGNELVNHFKALSNVKVGWANAGLAPAITDWKGLQKASERAGSGVHSGAQKANAAQATMKTSAHQNLSQVGTTYRNLDTTVGGALGDIGSNTNAIVSTFGGGKAQPFTISTSGKVGKHAEGGKVTRPIAVMGEEAPRHHEWVIATNPAYRERNVNYLHAAAADLGVPGFAQGGKHGHALAHPHVLGPQPLAGTGQGAVDKAYKAAQAYIKRHEPQGGPGGPLSGPKGTSAYMGVLMATWVRQALEYAAAHGSGNPQPTSGYRPGFDPHTVGGVSEHSKTQYPGGAVDFGGMVDPAALPKKMAVVNATRSFKYPLLAPAGFHDDGHASGTGHRKGGILGVAGHKLARFAQGGKHGMTVKGKVSYFGGSQTAGGKSADSDPGLALNLHPGTESGWDNSTTDHWMALSNAGNPVYGATTISGHSANLPIIDKGPAGFTGRAIDVTTPGVGKLGFTTSNFPTDAIGTVVINGGGAASEDVPAIFHGCRTKKLSFGSIPKSLHGVTREIKRRSSELPRYRDAVKAASGKPKIERALKANVTALEARRKQLRRAGALLRRKAAQRKIKRHLARQLGKITGDERGIEGNERAYEIANQTAEQIVDTEPLEPNLPATASDSEREAAEKTYLKDLESYVSTREEPAFMHVLGTENVWRDSIIDAQHHAMGLEGKWEGQIGSVEAEIKAINDLTKSHPAKWFHEHPKALANLKEMRAKLPVLRFKERELRNVLGEARGEFYGGVKNPVHPPIPPLAGTGTLEDSMKEVQGVHWPDQHGKIPGGLPAKRHPGSFGGAIWDTQGTIEELGLKVASVANAIGGGAGSGTTERDELLERMAREANQRADVSDRQLHALEGWDTLRQGIRGTFAGKFAAGGDIPSGMWGIAGETGVAELVAGPARVFSGSDSAAMMAGSASKVQVVVNGSIVQEPGDKRPAIEVRDAQGKTVETVLSATGTGPRHPGAFSTRP